MPTTDQPNTPGENNIPETGPAPKGNSGAHPKADPVAPIAVGKPDDAASMAIDQKHMEAYTNADPRVSSSPSCRRRRGIGATAPTTSFSRRKDATRTSSRTRSRKQRRTMRTLSVPSCSCATC